MKKIMAIVVALATIITLSIVFIAVKAEINPNNILKVSNNIIYDNTVGNTIIKTAIGITDFEIIIQKENVLNNMTVEALYPNVKIAETTEDYKVYYYQLSSPAEKTEIKAGTNLVQLNYNVPDDFSINNPTYALPITASANLKSDNSKYTNFNINNSTLYAYGNNYGDVNKDSKITKDDVYMLYNHLKNKTSITDPVSLRYADANGDGVIDKKDKDAIYAYALDHPEGELSKVSLENKEYVAYGDANEDSMINMIDTTYVMKYYIGNKFILTEQGKRNADVDNNGIIDVADGEYITKYYNKWSGYDKLPRESKVYFYGDINLDLTVGFSDITQLITKKYDHDNSYVWDEEVLKALGMESGSKPEFKEIVSLIDYVYEPHNIIYDLDGGTMPDDEYPKTFKSAEFSLLELPIPVKEGYTFSGWGTDIWKTDTGEDIDTSSMDEFYKWPTKDLTYTANWEAIEQ